MKKLDLITVSLIMGPLMLLLFVGLFMLSYTYPWVGAGIVAAIWIVAAICVFWRRDD